MLLEKNGKESSNKRNKQIYKVLFHQILHLVRQGINEALSDERNVGRTLHQSTTREKSWDIWSEFMNLPSNMSKDDLDWDTPTGASNHTPANAIPQYFVG